VPEPNTGCALWIGALSANGRPYATVPVAGARPRCIGAARAVWEAAHGPIAAGIFICHKCDVPLCVELAHLFPGTAADNSADMVHKQRQARGERAPKARLTAAQVVEIRARYATGREGLRTIARDYGVWPNAIKGIVRRTSWRHVA